MIQKLLQVTRADSLILMGLAQPPCPNPVSQCHGQHARNDLANMRFECESNLSACDLHSSLELPHVPRKKVWSRRGGFPVAEFCFQPPKPCEPPTAHFVQCAEAAELLKKDVAARTAASRPSYIQESLAQIPNYLRKLCTLCCKQHENEHSTALKNQNRKLAQAILHIAP